MRIAFVTLKHLLRGGGIEKYTLELGRRLVARGHEVTAFAMRHYGPVAPSVDGIRVVTVPSLHGRSSEKLTSAFAAAFALLSEARYDVVHCHSVVPGALGPLFRVRGARTVLQMHGLEWKRSRWSSFGRGMLRRLESASMRGHAAYTAVSREQCEHFRDVYGLEFKYIPTGADVATPRAPRLILERGLEPGRYLLFASRLVREKGAQYLIEAFRGLDVPYKLVVAGGAEGEPEFAEQLRRSAAGDSRISFPGHVEGELLEELFGHAALYVQPSDVEGLSIALIEAMAHARCCVVSDIPANLEAAGDTGVPFAHGSPPDLARALAYALEDAALREEKGRAARARAQRLYGWDRVADEFEALYESILAPAPSLQAAP